MADAKNVDELLAGLASMGFELDECQLAVQAGNSSLENALEWLLTRRNQLRASTSTVIDDSVTSRTQPPQHQQVEHSHTVDNSKPAFSLTSRFAVNDEQRRAKEHFEEKERETVRLEAKKRKLMDRKAKDQILKQIEDDKESRRTRLSHPPGTKPKAPPDSFSQSDFKPSFKTSGKCLLQIRFPAGLVKRQQFAADTKLSDVIMFVSKNCPLQMQDIELVQPFPHRVFSGGDGSCTLADLGLVPSGSLVVRRMDTVTVATSSDGIAASSSSPPPAETIEHHDEQDSPNDDDVEMPAVHPQPDVGAGGANVVGVFDAVGGVGAPPLFAGQRGHHVWGEGVKLGVPMDNPHAIQPVFRAQSALESAVKRMDIQNQVLQAAESRTRNTEVEQPLLHRQVPRLDTLCIKHVAKRLPGHHHPILSLGALPHSICDKIITQLMKDKALSPKSFQPFLLCFLRYLKLDCYLLVTNELLTCLRLHKSLTHLSLRACPLITDKALEAVAALKRLQSLTLSDCSQLTDKSFQYIKDLVSLTSLQMDNTKVTDKGVCFFIQNSSCCHQLVYLSLSGTGVTDESLEHLTRLTSLKTLGLESTQITNLEPVRQLLLLENLNMSRSKISDQSLLALKEHPSLQSLNILSTAVTDEGLQHLTGLSLTNLTLPNRLNISNVGIAFISGLPLTSLDLSDYINVTDDGIQHISSMNRLLKLSLSNTKLTDEGLITLQDLVQLEELNLDRTAVSDEGCAAISRMKNLQILSLSGTRITNALLRRGVLDTCKSLTTLNLSRTQVSNRGIQRLRLAALSQLNLSWTRVTSDCLVLISGCPSLKVIRTANSTPPDPGEESGDSDQE